MTGNNEQDSDSQAVLCRTLHNQIRTVTIVLKVLCPNADTVKQNYQMHPIKKHFSKFRLKKKKFSALEDHYRPQAEQR